MRLFQAPLDTCLDSPLVCQPLSSRFALHGLRFFKLDSGECIFSNVGTLCGEVFRV